MKEWWQKEQKRLLTSLALVVLSLSLLGIARNKLGVQGDAPLVAVLVLPLAYYLLSSGQLKSLKTPGGFEFLLVEAKVVELGAAGFNPLDAANQLFKHGVPELNELLRRTRDVAPVTLVIRPGNPEFELDALKAYFEAMRRFRYFDLVVFVNVDSELFGYMTPANFRALLEDDRTGAGLVELLQAAPAATFRLKSLEGMRTQPLTRGVSAKDAMTRLRDERLESIPVVDNENRLVGYVVRDQLVMDALLSLAKASD